MRYQVNVSIDIDRVVFLYIKSFVLTTLQKLLTRSICNVQFVHFLWIKYQRTPQSSNLIVSFWFGHRAYKWYFQFDQLLRSMMTSSNGNIFRITGPLCGEFTGTGEFPAQRPVTRSFDVFFYLRLNKRLSKQPWGWWFETPSWSLWRHGNEWRNPHRLYKPPNTLIHLD